MFLERPLATLPVDVAERFVRAVAPDLSITDPAVITLGFQRIAANWQDAGGPAAFEPVALFRYRALDDRTGIASVAALDIARAADLQYSVARAIAEQARAAGHDRVVLEAGAKIACEQLVEQILAGFASDAEPARAVRAR